MNNGFMLLLSGFLLLIFNRTPAPHIRITCFVFQSMNRRNKTIQALLYLVLYLVEFTQEL